MNKFFSSKMTKVFSPKKKTLAIIGSRGMLGSDLVEYFHQKFQVTAISREDYDSYIGKSFDIIINANGSSKRFWANQNQMEDFSVSTVSVYRSIFDFPCELYIYISSVDVYDNHTTPKYTNEDTHILVEKLQPYGFHKYLGELIVKKYKKKFLILRPSMILGTNLKKGPIYDILHGNPLFITAKTKLQLITTTAIGEIIEVLLDKSEVNKTINIGGKGNLSFTKIIKLCQKNITISPQAGMQIYEVNIEKLKNLFSNLKTSDEYLMEFLARK